MMVSSLDPDRSGGGSEWVSSGVLPFSLLFTGSTCSSISSSRSAKAKVWLSESSGVISASEKSNSPAMSEPLGLANVLWGVNGSRGDEEAVGRVLLPLSEEEEEEDVGTREGRSTRPGRR